MSPQSPIVTVMANAALKCARKLVRDFGEVENLQVSKKGPADFVTAADLEAERTLRNELSRAHPEYGFLMEEGGVIEGKDPDHRWIIDPLDGTTNFLHGLPFFAISIALEHKGEITAGVIYDPLRNELFWAEGGRGAYMNAQRLRVSARRNLDEALIATGMPFKGHASHPEYGAQLDNVMTKVAGIRRFGSAALDLAYVAAGRFDGYWEYGLEPWDIAAGTLLVTEAGGYASEIGGGKTPLASGDILAANDHLHLRIAKLLRAASAGG